MRKLVKKSGNNVKNNLKGKDGERKNLNWTQCLKCKYFGHIEDTVLCRMSVKMLKHYVQNTRSEFELSMVGDVTYFPDFKVKLMNECILIPKVYMLEVVALK